MREEIKKQEVMETKWLHLSGHEHWATPDSLERHLVLSNKYLYLSNGTISYYFWSSRDQILHVSKFNAC